MKKAIFIVIVLVISNTVKSQQNRQLDFDKFFENKTMRIDYFHTGTASEEHFSIDRILNDGPWPGSKKQLLDELKYGLYFFEVKDLAS